MYVLGRRKPYEVKSRLLVKKRYSLIIYRATGKGWLIYKWTKQSLSLLMEGASIHRYTGNPLKRVIFHFAQMSTILPLKRPFFSPSFVLSIRSNVLRP